MVNAVLRGLAAAALVILPVVAPALAHAAETLPLADAVAGLQVATECRNGYVRNKFRHWNTGDDPAHGCNTRAEVLLHEAVDPPTVGAGCRLTGGSWWSYYDASVVTSAGSLDIDDMVPLAEAWDSGASAWTRSGARRTSTTRAPRPRSSRSPHAPTAARPTRPPAQWMPPGAEVHCRYVGEWVGTKPRWGLAVDDVELAALEGAGADCLQETVTYEPGH